MKMYFYYGVMGSSKTANILMKKFDFEEHGRKTILLKPSVDDRDGATKVKSRAGLESEAVVLKKDATIADTIKDLLPVDVILVDEVQFLTKNQILELRQLVNDGTMVMCYGLKTDYMGNLFEGSATLLAVADTIREIPSMCVCGRKAIVNARYKNGKIVYSGDQIDIGGDDKYKALCYQCWSKGKLE